MNRLGARAGLTLITALLTFFAGLPALAANGPQYFDYQVQLPQSPTNSTDAIATLDAREQATLATVACGDELSFAKDSVAHEADENTSARILAKLEWGGGHSDLEGRPRINGFCRFSLTIRWLDLASNEICALVKDSTSCKQPDEVTARNAVADALWAQLIVGDLTSLKYKVLQFKGGFVERLCGRATLPDGTPVDHSIVGWRRLDPVSATDPAVTSPGRAGTIQIDFAISQECLLRQAAQALGALVIPVRGGQQQVAGTDGAPCRGFGLGSKVYGDWDMAERNLIRIAYLIKKYGLASNPIFQDPNDHLRNDLLTLDRGLEGDSHNVFFGCGNSPGHTGSPEDRAGDRNGHGNPPGDALSDLGWFLLMLAILLAVLAALLAAAIAIAGLIGAIIAAIAAVVAVIATFLLNIPETENHLLAINSTKYLNNQLIVQDLGNDLSMTAPYISDQIELKKWLLKRMQGFLQNDFIEYNSRPYQRHSIESIRNLFDYAGDPGRPNLRDDDLRNGAQLVLDYTAAKFGIGNSQSRRMTPYRRHRSDFAKVVDTDASGWSGLLDLSSSADHQVGLGLLYSGQTQQLPLGQASRAYAAETINAATSDYTPEATILDLAIGKDIPIYQRMSHRTYEIYSSGPGFLISAGGLATVLAYPVTGIPAIDGHKDDWGSGVPTTLFLSAENTPNLGFLAPGLPPDPALAEQRAIYQTQQALFGPGRAPPLRNGDFLDSSVNGVYAKYLDDLAPDAKIKSTLGEFIRIKGEYDVDFDSDGQKLPTYDNNLCVWDGFACGTNIELGLMATDCVLDVSAANWTFIDSAKCKGRETAPRVLIAVFKKDCPKANNCTNYGLFEVIDADSYSAVSHAAPSDDLFVRFRDQIVGANTALNALPAGTNMVADYHSARGQKIEFSCWGHESDSGTWGVYHVDNIPTHKLDEWPFAGGEWSNSGQPLRADVQTPMRSIGDGVVAITSPRLRASTDPTKPRVLTLDFSDRDHPKAAAEN